MVCCSDGLPLLSAPKVRKNRFEGSVTARKQREIRRQNGCVKNQEANVRAAHRRRRNRAAISPYLTEHIKPKGASTPKPAKRSVIEEL
jgi:hypothetical protein